MVGNAFSGTLPAQRSRRVQATSGVRPSHPRHFAPRRIQQAKMSLLQDAGTTCPELMMLCRIAALLAARHLMCPVDPVMGATNREAPVAAARQLAMYLAHVGLGLSQCQVAFGFGRDRKTIAHACRRVEDRRDVPAFDAQVACMEVTLRWAAGR